MSGWALVGTSGATPLTNSATCVIPKPAGAQAGDVLACFVWTNFSSALWTPPGGNDWVSYQWKRLIGYHGYFVTTLEGSEGSDFTFTRASGLYATMGMAACFRPSGITIYDYADPFQDYWPAGAEWEPVAWADPVTGTLVGPDHSAEDPEETHFLVVDAWFHYTDGVPSFSGDELVMGLTDEGVLTTLDTPVYARGYLWWGEFEDADGIPDTDQATLSTAGATQWTNAVRLILPSTVPTVASDGGLYLIPERAQVGELPYQVHTRML